MNLEAWIAGALFIEIKPQTQRRTAISVIRHKQYKLH